MELCLRVGAAADGRIALYQSVNESSSHIKPVINICGDGCIVDRINSRIEQLIASQMALRFNNKDDGTSIAYGVFMIYICSHLTS